METNKGDDWLEAIAISNYETMWLAHGSQVIDHMTGNKRKGETRLAGRILYAQAHGEGVKNRHKWVVTVMTKECGLMQEKERKTKKNM